MSFTIEQMLLRWPFDLVTKINKQFLSANQKRKQPERFNKKMSCCRSLSERREPLRSFLNFVITGSSDMTLAWTQINLLAKWFPRIVRLSCDISFSKSNSIYNTAAALRNFKKLLIWEKAWACYGSFSMINYTKMIY